MPRLAWVVPLVVLLGCGKRSPPVLEPITIEPERVAEIERMRVSGPVRWTDPAGAVCLDVPEGWSGWVGGGDALLALEHPSGVIVSLRRDPSPGSRPGFVRMFEDAGSYRDVPLLYPASTVTWVSEAPKGPTIQEWSGQLGGQLVRIEVSYPSGRIILGRQVVQPLLDGLCRP